MAPRGILSTPGLRPWHRSRPSSTRAPRRIRHCAWFYNCSEAAEPSSCQHGAHVPCVIGVSPMASPAWFSHEKMTPWLFVDHKLKGPQMSPTWLDTAHMSREHCHNHRFLGKGHASAVASAGEERRATAGSVLMDVKR